MLLLDNQQAADLLSFKPMLFRFSNIDDKQKLQELIDDKKNIQIHDKISSHLDELMKCRNPWLKKPTRETIDRLKQEYLGDLDLQEYGVWIYYPWNNTLIHCLDEEEFVEVRTNRNHYKITHEEQNILRGKKIGIVGLSVGQSIALTMAMERICGEIRIADFDIAELSNLNRLRTGIQNIGLNKTIIAAREIAEIDPFLKVEVYNEGLIKENIDAFFNVGGKLDLLVEVCDGLDIKIESRYKAKSLGIPVIMDTNDRGMLDVERFDLEPERPILHGLADGLDPDNIKNLTNEEKIPYVLNMIGAESISTRLKASMLEVEQSVNTWPQLASSVVLGGALTTDVSRRILLGQFNESGRYYVDMEDLVGDKAEKTPSSSLIHNPYSELNHEQLAKLISQVTLHENHLEKADLSVSELDQIIDAALAAPSAGNNQPWKWVYEVGVLYLFHDRIKSHSWGDYAEMGSTMACGAAIENVNVQAAALGLSAVITTFPINNEEQLLATISFLRNPAEVSTQQKTRATNIFKRYTNRKSSIRKELSEEFFNEFIDLATENNGINIHVIKEEGALSELADIIAECDKVRMLNQLGHEEFYSEIRWTEQDALAKRDGIELKAVDITPSEVAGFRIAQDWNALELISNWDKGDGFKKLSMNAVKSASAMVVFTIKEFTKNNLLSAGRSIEKCWLYATEQQVSVYPMLSSVFFFNRLIDGKGVDLSVRDVNKLIALRTRFLNILPDLNSETETEVFVMKVSLADDIGVRSLRKLKQELFINNTDAKS